jgi:hypothetical protein
MNTARQVFGDVLVDRLLEAAADLKRAAHELETAASNIAKIGTKTGVSPTPVTASDLAAGAVRAVHRNNPNLSGVVLAAADYDKNVTS